MGRNVRLGLATTVAWWMFLAASLCSAQTQGSWPAIRPDELALKDLPGASNAPAVVLDQEIYVDDNKSYETDYSRIKVLTAEGRKYGDVEITYVQQETDIVDIRARTTSPAGVSTEFTGTVFDKSIVKSKRLKVQAKTFTLPNVDIGTIVEYSYKKTWHRSIPDVFLHPTTFFFGRTFSWPSASWVLPKALFVRHARLVVHPFKKTPLDWATIRPPEGSQVTQLTDGDYQLEINDLRPIVSEPFDPPDAVLDHRIYFFYVYPWHTESNYWPSASHAGGDDVDQFLGNGKTAAKVVAETVSPSDPPEVKLRKLYVRSQQINTLTTRPEMTQKQLKQEDFRKNKNVEEVLQHNYAFANEINLVFVALARAAGFDACVVRLVERSRDAFYKEVLDVGQFNAEVVMVKYGDKTVFLDPATPFCPYGLLPWEETGVAGLRLLASTYWASDLSVFVNIPPSTSDQAITRRKATIRLDAEGNADGDLQIRFEGQEGLQRKLDHVKDDDTGRKSSAEKEVRDLLPAESTVELQSTSGWDNVDEALTYECKFSIPHLAVMAGKRMLVPAAIFNINGTTPFPSPTREHAIDFSHPYRSEDDLTFVIPSGMKVEALPGSLFDDKQSVSFRSSVSETAGGIEFHRLLTVDHFFFLPAGYNALRNFFNQVMKNNGEKIVLSSATPSQ